MSDEPPTEEGRTDANNYVAIRRDGIRGPPRGFWFAGPDPEDVAQQETQLIRHNRLLARPNPDITNHDPAHVDNPHPYADILNPPADQPHFNGGELLRGDLGLHEWWTCGYHHLTTLEDEYSLLEKLSCLNPGFYALVQRDHGVPRVGVVVSAETNDSLTELEIDQICLNLGTEHQTMYCFRKYPHIYHESIGGLILLLANDKAYSKEIRDKLKVPRVKNRIEGQPLSTFVFPGVPRNIDQQASKQLQDKHNDLFSC